jgi:DNA-binding transcriptional ArsR family regulator
MSLESGRQPDDGEQRGQRRRLLDDPLSIRALAHPLRLELQSIVGRSGKITAADAARELGISHALASHHLRQLAKYGFVEEAEGGTGRKRPWKLRHLGMRFSDVHEDPETATAARTLDRVLRDRYFARARQAFEDRQSLPEQWRAVTGMNQMGLYLTPDELKAIDEEIIELLFKRYADRRTPSDAHPEGAERVEILTLAYRV